MDPALADFLKVILPVAVGIFSPIVSFSIFILGRRKMLAEARLLDAQAKKEEESALTEGVDRVMGAADMVISQMEKTILRLDARVSLLTGRVDTLETDKLAQAELIGKQGERIAYLERGLRILIKQLKERGIEPEFLDSKPPQAD